MPRVTEILEFFADEDGWQINVCSDIIFALFIILNVIDEQELVDLRGGQPRLLPSLARYPMAARHPTPAMQQHVVNSYTSICRVTIPPNQICDTCGYTADVLVQALLQLLESFPEALTREGDMTRDRFQNHYLSLISGNVTRIRRAVKDCKAAVYIYYY